MRPSYVRLAQSALALIASGSMPVFAQTANDSTTPGLLITPSYVDLHYIGMAEIEADHTRFDDGDGYGARARFENVDTELRDLRVGLRLSF